MSQTFRFIPSALFGEIYFPWVERPGFVLEKLERAQEDDFYQAWEIGTQFSTKEYPVLRRLVEQSGKPLTQWLTPMLEGKGLNIADAETAQRHEAVNAVLEHLPLSAECGVSTVALVTGSDPGPALRDQAMSGFADSLSAICERASTLGIHVIVEPLDRFAHKKRLIGPTPETVDLLNQVRLNHANLGLAFDTAHVALNEESVSEALRLSAPIAAQIHLANAVLDKADPLYGDRHISPGAPGFLTVDAAADILRRARALGIGAQSGLRVAVEARGLINEGEDTMESRTREFLKQVLSQVEQDA